MLEVVWATLTDYENLAKVVPNLVSNKVVRTDDDGRGARLKQVGAAKIAPGITFTAQTTLDVRECAAVPIPHRHRRHLRRHHLRRHHLRRHLCHHRRPLPSRRAGGRRGCRLPMRPTTSPRRTSSGSKSAVCPVWRQRPIGLPGPAEGSGRSARPTRAQLEQLAGLPWAQQLASGRPKDDDFPF